MVTLYGIRNCNTMKKARKWLDENGVEYTFHDYKKEGISADQLTNWCAVVGWEVLVNKRGTTWRKLPEEARADLDQARAIDLMVSNTSLIKRPVLSDGDQLLVGFSTDTYSALFQ